MIGLIELNLYVRLCELLKECLVVVIVVSFSIKFIDGDRVVIIGGGLNKNCGFIVNFIVVVIIDMFSVYVFLNMLGVL